MKVPLEIKGSGKYLPPTRVTSVQIDDELGLPRGTAFAKSGVEVRHRGYELGPSRMNAEAARQALDAAGLEFSDVDVLISATAPAEQPLPCTAALTQRALGEGTSGIPCFDVDATCLSFLTALETAAFGLWAGRYETALIVTGSVNSGGALNPNSVETYSLFGDGAAAFVLGRPTHDGPGLTASHMETYAEAVDTCLMKGGLAGQWATRFTEDTKEDYMFAMDGRQIFKEARKRVGPAFARTLEKAHCRLEDIDLVVPHQASASAISLMRKHLEIPQDKVMDILADHGNCIAASVPMALHEAIQTNRLRRGDRFMLLGTGAGLSVGLAVLEY